MRIHPPSHPMAHTWALDVPTDPETLCLSLRDDVQDPTGREDIACDKGTREADDVKQLSEALHGWRGAACSACRRRLSAQGGCPKQATG